MALSTIKTNSIDDSAITNDKIENTTITGAKITNTTIDVTAKITGAVPVANGSGSTLHLHQNCLRCRSWQ